MTELGASPTIRRSRTSRGSRPSRWRGMKSTKTPRAERCNRIAQSVAASSFQSERHSSKCTNLLICSPGTRYTLITSNRTWGAVRLRQAGEDMPVQAGAARVACARSTADFCRRHSRARCASSLRRSTAVALPCDQVDVARTDSPADQRRATTVYPLRRRSKNAASSPPFRPVR